MDEPLARGVSILVDRQRLIKCLPRREIRRFVCVASHDTDQLDQIVFFFDLKAATDTNVFALVQLHPHQVVSFFHLSIR